MLTNELIREIAFGVRMAKWVTYDAVVGQCSISFSVLKFQSFKGSRVQ
jgi:hypothetical protein